MLTKFYLPSPVNVVSYLSPNFFWFYEAIGEYLSRTFNVLVQVKQSWADPFTDLLQQTELDIAFVCGLPLIRVCHATPDRLLAIAAPVMQSERYQNRPIYFSDVVINTASSITQFEQLAGKRFCFNDLGSNSGYNLMRYHLMQKKYPMPFFREVMQSGSHQQSIRWIIEQKADCAAIDSVVLEQELRQFQKGRSPELSQLRVIDSLGSTPMPPIVASHRLEPVLELLQLALLRPDAELHSQMQRAGIFRFTVVQTSDYEVIYQIYDQTHHSKYAVVQ
jgi:phosphonate transport system substrate-binding protein